MEAGRALSHHLKERNEDAIVEVAHMEIAEPSIESGIESCVQKGATHIQVVACFLSRGRHLSEDVPRLVARACESHPNVTFQISPPLLEMPGFISMLADYLVAR